MEVLDKIEEKNEIKFVAVETGSFDNIIASGFNAEEVTRLAEKSGLDFILTYEFDENKTFIF